MTKDNKATPAPETVQQDVWAVQRRYRWGSEWIYETLEIHPTYEDACGAATRLMATRDFGELTIRGFRVSEPYRTPAEMHDYILTQIAELKREGQSND